MPQRWSLVKRGDILVSPHRSGSGSSRWLIALLAATALAALGAPVAASAAAIAGLVDISRQMLDSLLRR